MTSISVLISVHNGHKYLSEAIQSVLDQTFKEFELIVVDDASTDGTLEQLRKITDPRLKIIPLKKNVGLADALNIALETVDTDFVARMDADDVCELDRLTEQFNFLSLNPDVVLVGSSYTLIDDEGREFGSQLLSCDNAALQDNLLVSNQFCHPSVMMRTEVLKAVGGYRNIGGRYAQDYDLWLRIAEKGKLANLEKPLLRYRIHESQVSIKKLSDQAKTAELYKLLAVQRRTSGEEDLEAARMLLARKSSEIRAGAASSLLYWSVIFHKQNRRKEAKSLQWRAIKTAPFSFPVRRMVMNVIAGRFQRLFSFLH